MIEYFTVFTYPRLLAIQIHKRIKHYHGSYQQNAAIDCRCRLVGRNDAFSEVFTGVVDTSCPGDELNSRVWLFMGDKLEPNPTGSRRLCTDNAAFGWTVP